MIINIEGKTGHGLNIIINTKWDRIHLSILKTQYHENF